MADRITDVQANGGLGAVDYVDGSDLKRDYFFDGDNTIAESSLAADDKFLFWDESAAAGAGAPRKVTLTDLIAAMQPTYRMAVQFYWGSTLNEVASDTASDARWQQRITAAISGKTVTLIGLQVQAAQMYGTSGSTVFTFSDAARGGGGSTKTISLAHDEFQTGLQVASIVLTDYLYAWPSTVGANHSRVSIQAILEVAES